jgi:threonine aldolase
MPEIEIDLTRVQTNMIFFNLRPEAGITAPELLERLKAHGILTLDMGKYRFRFVTHYWIRPEHVDQVLQAMQKELA